MLLIRKENEISKQFDRGEMINKDSVMVLDKRLKLLDQMQR